MNTEYTDIIHKVISESHIPFDYTVNNGCVNFVASGYTLMYRLDLKDYVSVNIFGDQVIMPEFDADLIDKQYTSMIERQLEEHAAIMQKLKQNIVSSKCESIPKKIIQFIRYMPETIVSVGVSSTGVKSIVIFDDSYMNHVYDLSDFARELPALEKYMTENKISKNTKIYICGDQDYLNDVLINNI